MILLQDFYLNHVIGEFHLKMTDHLLQLLIHKFLKVFENLLYGLFDHICFVFLDAFVPRKSGIFNGI